MHSRRSPQTQRQWWSAPAAFLVTVLALPVTAATVPIPDDPLTTGARVPPNIMFILDNSGSMALVSMPFDVQDPDYTGTGTGASYTGLRDNPRDRSYLNNTIYYDPRTNYQPWLTANGTRMSGGQNVASVYLDWNKADNGRGTRDLRGNDEAIFYVPKTGVTSSTNAKDFDRYSIDSSGTVVVAELTQVSGFPKGPLSSSMDANTQRTFTIRVTSGTAMLTVSTSGGGGGVDLNLIRPNGTTQCSSSSGNGGETCTAANPATGDWKVQVYRDNSATFSNVYLDAYVTRMVPKTPTGRTQADELTNIATWYSYYRTRMKTAKGGASEAFAPLGGGYRVGYTPINGRSSHLSSTGTNPIIPVNINGGRFEDDTTSGSKNKTNWFNSVQSEVVRDGSTPLRTTLSAVGEYYTRVDKNGPWGDGTDAKQLSCRPSFSILTTDGYWNDNTSSKFGLTDDDGDGHSVTLADIANYYYRTDLRANLTNNVPPSSPDPATWQHMVTFGISIGLSGTLTVTDPPPASNAAIWPNPMTAENETRIDDLWHAAVNGHGSFVPASNPTEFAAGLTKALESIAGRASSYSNVASNATSLRTGGKVFNASYVPGTWSGEVKAWTLDSLGRPDTLAWTASVPKSGRKVFTFNGSGRTFPTTTQRDALARTGGALNYPVTGAENAAYIKGDQSKEGSGTGQLRVRTETTLGDIVNSSPAYVADTNTLYVGANDGMLHAFNGTTGAEQFAYVPGIINIGNLARLSRGDYTHNFFVDGPIAVSSRKLTPNKNLLIGALGRGGKGLYGLDVSAPGSFGTSNVSWELGETPDNNMGLVLGRPILAPVKTGATAAVLGNGVNSANGKAVLLVVDLATGGVIREIDTLTGSVAVPNGLSAPTGVVGPDGKTLAYAYAGDLQGNVWKFDLTNSSPSQWTATKLFTAVSSVTGKVQPITGGVTVALDPRTYRRWILFGTGSFMTIADAEDKTPLAQSMYGFIDSGTAVTRADLQVRQIINTGEEQNGYPVRTFEEKASLPNDKKGWYVNLPADGERIVQDAQMVSNVLVTASMLPTGDACEASGSGYINAVDAFTGTSTGKSFFDLDRDGDTSDTNIGDIPVGSVNFGVGMPTLPIFLDGTLIVGGTGGADKPAPGGIVRKEWSRVSWREIRGD